MSWLTREKIQRMERFATDREMQSTFLSESENLCWIALVITGDPLVIRNAMVDASRLQKTTSGVFVDWLARWAHSATARASANLIRDSIVRSAREYEILECEHLEYEPLTSDEILTVRKLNPLEIIAGLDPLARATLVFRGVQHASISDCSLFLRLPRRTVAKAYSHAVIWLQQHGAKIDKADPKTCTCTTSSYLV